MLPMNVRNVFVTLGTRDMIEMVCPAVIAGTTIEKGD